MNRWLSWVQPLTDMLCITMVFMLGFWFRHYMLSSVMGSNFSLSPYNYLLSGLVLGALQVSLMTSFNAYRREFGLGLIEEVACILKASVMAMIFAFAITFITRQLFFSRFVLVFSCPVSIVLLSIWHWLIRKIVARNSVPVTVLMLGNSQEARQLASFMETRAQISYRVKAFADPSLPPEEICRRIEENSVDELVIVDKSIPMPALSQIILYCERVGIQYKIAADVFSLVSLTAKVAHMGGTTLIESVPAPLSGWGLVLKRTLDLVLTSFFLILLLPVFLFTSLAIFIDTGFPLFYKQSRLGIGNIPFKMLKFRSMRVGAHEEKTALADKNESKGILFKIKNDPRVTKTGKFIRRWSIDELPQLFNVMSGKMSLVGPRPPLPEEVEEYSRRDFKRLQTIPGVTGVWQISGRSKLGFDEMVKLDLYYVDNWSIWMDLAILMLTPSEVIKGSGAY